MDLDPQLHRPRPGVLGRQPDGHEPGRHVLHGEPVHFRPLDQRVDRLIVPETALLHRPSLWGGSLIDAALVPEGFWGQSPAAPRRRQGANGGRPSGLRHTALSRAALRGSRPRPRPGVADQPVAVPRGTSSVKRAPPPGALAAVAPPPCSAAMPVTMARPSPAPA